MCTDVLEHFWALFAHQVLDAPYLRLLQNPNLPILEVNAGYGSSLALLEQHSARLERPCLLVSSQAPEGWEVLHQRMLLEWQALGTDSAIQIEQVGWTQASLLAQVWCEQHQAQSWHALVLLELGRTMQKIPDLCAYVAYRQHQPVGMLLAMPKNGWWHNSTPKQMFASQPQGAFSGWWAGERQVAEALFARAATDFSGLEVLVPAAWGLVGEVVFICHASAARTA